MKATNLVYNVLFASIFQKREIFNDLAPLLWYSFGTIAAALLQEIVSVYPALSPPTLSARAAARACNALALLQTVATHTGTRTLFLEAAIPLYLFPFLNTTSQAKSFEHLRVTSLGFLGALAKVDDTEVVKFLLKIEVIPLCLRIMGTGSELSKTVATFIVQKIMRDEVGLQHICATPECFFQAASALANMVIALTEQPSTRLLKHVICCYIRLTDDPRYGLCTALRTHLPEALRNGTFDNCLRDDPAARNFLTQLLDNLAGPAGRAPHPGPGPRNQAQVEHHDVNRSGRCNSELATSLRLSFR
ncbi:unnamed protein product [Urochloa decumbens]|uniref:Cell differentiation protein rcd1 n=1 Tax=Urochloa decumbens TaxID=240449 RepID=A0ABC9CID8_9POAL